MRKEVILLAISPNKTTKKKEEIILSAVKIMNEKGHQRATMEEIAAELQMTKGSLYYYFRNKEDLIFRCHELVLEQAIDELREAFHSNVSNVVRLQQMIAIHVKYAVKEKESFNMIIKPDETFSTDHLHPILKKRNEYEGWFDRVILAGIECGEFNINEPKIVRMILLGALNWIQQWYKKAGDKSLEELQQIYSDYLLKVMK